MTQLQNTNLRKGNALMKAEQERLSKAIPFSAVDSAMNDDGFFSETQKLRVENVYFHFNQQVYDDFATG